MEHVRREVLRLICITRGRFGDDQYSTSRRATPDRDNRCSGFRLIAGDSTIGFYFIITPHYIYTRGLVPRYYVQWMCVRTRTPYGVRIYLYGATVSQWPKVATLAESPPYFFVATHVQLGYRSLIVGVKRRRLMKITVVKYTPCAVHCLELFYTAVRSSNPRWLRGSKYNRPFFSRCGEIICLDFHTRENI